MLGFQHYGLGAFLVPYEQSLWSGNASVKFQKNKRRTNALRLLEEEKEERC